MSTSANVVASLPPEPSDRLPRLRCGRLRAETDASARISKLLAEPRRLGSNSGWFLDHLTILRSILMGAVAASAEASSAFTLATLSGRLVEVLKEIGKITGEIERLNPSINLTTNIAIMSDPRMIELQSGLLTIARAHPEVRGDLIALLRNLDSRPPLANRNGAQLPLIEAEPISQ